MKIAKVSGLSGYNFGDKILSLCLDKLLERQQYSIISFNIYPLKEVNVKQRLTENEKKRKIKILVSRFYLLIYIKNILSILMRLKYYYNIVKSGDRLYYGGGNLVSNANGSNYLFISFLLSLFSKKNQFVILFCGVGPFTFFFKKQLSYIFNKSKFIIVRDQYSANFFKHKNKVYVLPDPAILSSYFFPVSNNVAKKYFIVNLIDYSKFDLDIAKKASTELLCENINKLACMTSLTPVFVSTSIADNSYMHRCYKHYIDQYKAENSKYIIPSIIGDFNMVIGETKFSLVNRMHCGIISISYGVPTLFYPWQKKINGFLQHIAKDYESDFLYNDLNMNSDEIFSKIQTIHKKYNLEEIIKNLSSQLLNFKY